MMTIFYNHPFLRRAGALCLSAAILLSLSGCGSLNAASQTVDLSEQSVPVTFLVPAEETQASAYHYKTNTGEITLSLQAENPLDDNGVLTIELWKKGEFSSSQAKQTSLSSDRTDTCFSGLDSNTVYYLKYINSDSHDVTVTGTLTDGEGLVGENTSDLVDTGKEVPASDQSCDDLGDDGSVPIQASLEKGTEFCSERPIRTNTEQIVVSNPSDVDLTVCLYVVAGFWKEEGATMELTANSSVTFPNLSASQRYRIGVTAQEEAEVTLTVSAK